MLFLTISTESVCAQQTFSTGWTTVATMNPWSNGVNVGVQNLSNDPSGCANQTGNSGNGGLMNLPTSATEYKTIYANIMAAFYTGKQVNIYTNGCTSGGSQIIGLLVK